MKRDGRRSRILHLMLTGKRAHDFEIAQLEPAATRVDGKILDGPVAGESIRSAGMRAQDEFSVERLFGEDCWDAWLQNACFFRGDLRERAAEEGLVIVIDGSDHAELGHYHVGG